MDKCCHAAGYFKAGRIEDPLNAGRIVYHAVDRDGHKYASAKAVVEIDYYDSEQNAYDGENKIEEQKPGKIAERIHLTDLDRHMPYGPYQAKDNARFQRSEFFLKPGKRKSPPSDLFHKASAVEEQARNENKDHFPEAVNRVERKKIPLGYFCFPIEHYRIEHVNEQQYPDRLKPNLDTLFPADIRSPEPETREKLLETVLPFCDRGHYHGRERCREGKHQKHKYPTEAAFDLPDYRH